MHEPTIRSRTWAEINLGALKHNLGIAKATGKKVMCVIKADAYGHGAVACGRFLEENGADAFAVACLSEALELRRAGIELPILILGYTPAQYADSLAAYAITQTVVDEQSAIEMNNAAKRAGVTVEVHIKLDTGMSRTGIMCQGEAFYDSAACCAERICELGNLNVTGMYTHLAAADSPEEIEYTQWQIDSFTAVRDRLESRGVTPAICHASNSAAIMNNPNAHFDMVREGIMLYGLYPDSIPRVTGPLMPVMTLKSRVAQIREFPEGTTVSYGRTYRAKSPIKCAVISAGYADGYPRRLSNRSHIKIGGESYPQIGRVCMDVIMADITGGSVQRGDEVVLFGAKGMSLEEVAQEVGTINYEIACLVTCRAKRVYIE